MLQVFFLFFSFSELELFTDSLQESDKIQITTLAWKWQRLLLPLWVTRTPRWEGIPYLRNWNTISYLVFSLLKPALKYGTKTHYWKTGYAKVQSLGPNKAVPVIILLARKTMVYITKNSSFSRPEQVKRGKKQFWQADQTITHLPGNSLVSQELNCSK